MIRPSQLSIARYCDLAPQLQEAHPNRNENTDVGNAIDSEATADLCGKKTAESPDAKAISAWVREKFEKEHWKCWLQTKVALTDEEWGTTLTEGTPDFQAADQRSAPIIVTVDFKKREQYAAGLLADPDDNLQTHAYSIARCEIEGISLYRNVLLLFGDGEVEPLWSRPFQAFGPIRNEIRDIQLREVKNPRGVTGPHCLGCYPRLHCPEWMSRAHYLVDKITGGMEITKENRGQILSYYLAMKDAVDPVGEQLRATVAEWGPIELGGGKEWRSITVKGRKSTTIDKEAMQRDGVLDKYSSTVQGGPYQQFRVGKVKNGS